MSDAALIAELKQQNAQLNGQVAVLKRQLDWFQRQLFGRKSEQRLEFDPVVQQDLLQGLGVPPTAVPAEPETKDIPGHKHRKARNPDDVNDIGLRCG